MPSIRMTLPEGEYSDPGQHHGKLYVGEANVDDEQGSHSYRTSFAIRREVRYMGIIIPGFCRLGPAH